MWFLQFRIVSQNNFQWQWFPQKQFQKPLKNKPQKQTPCLLSLIVILLQLMSSCVKKTAQKGACHPLLCFYYCWSPLVLKQITQSCGFVYQQDVCFNPMRNKHLEYQFVFPLTIKLIRNTILTIRRVLKRKNCK